VSSEFIISLSEFASRICGGSRVDAPVVLVDRGNHFSLFTRARICISRTEVEFTRICRARTGLLVTLGTDPREQGVPAVIVVTGAGIAGRRA